MQHGGMPLSIILESQHDRLPAFIVRHAPGLSAAFVLLLGLGLRLRLLGEQSVWWDEGLAVWAARQDLLSIVRWTSTDVHPPLYFWLLHAWRLLVGESEFGVRFLSLLCGMLLVAVAGRLGHMLGGKRVGFYAAALVAIEPALVWWSQETRPYELAALLVLLSLFFTLRLTADTPPTRLRRFLLWIGYIVTTAAALYTLYLTGVVIVLEAGYVLSWAAARKDRRIDLAPWAVAIAAVLLLFLPWLIYILGRMHSWSVAEPFGIALFLRLYVALLGMGVSTNVEGYLLPSAVFVAAGAVALLGLVVRKGRSDWRRIGLLLACVLVLPALVFALTLPRGLFYTPKIEARYLVLFAPAAYVLLAWGLDALGTRLGALACAVLALLAAAGLLAHYDGRYLADDYQTLVSTLRSGAQAQDAVVLHSDSDWPVFAYHYDGPWTGIPAGETVTSDSAAARLGNIVASHAAVWLVVTPDAARIDPLGKVEAFLQQTMARQAEYVIGDKRLVLFARAGETRPAHMTAATRRVTAGLGADLTLNGYEQQLSRVRAGERVYLALYWQGTGCPGETPVVVTGSRGQELQRLPVSLCAPSGQTSLQRTLFSLLVSPLWPAGEFAVHIGNATVGRFVVLSPKASGAGATPEHSLNISFDGQILLRGFDIELPAGGVVRSGDKVKVTLYWQAQTTLERSYTVFVHLLGQQYNARSANFLWGQHDGIPALGERPTTSWQPGVTVMDEHALTVAAQAPPGEYSIEVGLYDAVAPPYPRLTVKDGRGIVVDDKVILQAIVVGE